MAFDPSTAKPLPGGFDPSTAKPEQTGGAAFGIYPKQRATPSSPETKEAVRKGSEAAASGLETLGVFPPSEEKEFDPGRVGTAAEIGAGVGLAGPKALEKIGRGMRYIPSAPVKAAGRGVQALGKALGTTPTTSRMLTGAGGFAAADVGGQLAEQAGLPGIVGMSAGAKALEQTPRALGALGRMAVGTTQPEITALSKKAEDLGFVLEPAQLRKDRPLASPGFSEGAKVKNEKIATELASKATGKQTENITPGFVGERMKDLGADYDKIFNRNFTIDSDLVKVIRDMKNFEVSVGPAGVGEVTRTADNIIRRFNEELIASQQKNIENRIKRIMQTQQRGGVEPITRLKKDWPTIRDSSAPDAPVWMGDVEKTIKELSDNLGLKTTPKVWASSPRREGLYGMATGDGNIVINDRLNVEGAVATALHEFGHQAEFQLFIHAPRNEREAVVKAFNDQMASIPVGAKTVEQHRPLTAAKYPEESRKGIPQTGFEKGYLRDFSEWFAEQTSRWITTTKPPTDTVEKFFAKVADSWKKIYQRVVGYIPLTSEVDKFFRANWRGDLIEQVGAEAGAMSAAAEPAIAEGVLAKIKGDELQRLRSNMQRLARTAANGEDRNAAAQFVKALDEGLGRYDPASLKKLQETNRMYAATAALRDGIEQGFITQGKVSLQGLGNYLAKNVYGYGSGTTAHPLYDLGYLGQRLNIRSRAEGVDYPGYDAVAALLGRGKQAVSSVVGGRTQLARDLQRSLSEKEGQ
jgi:hypothetical protein